MSSCVQEDNSNKPSSANICLHSRWPSLSQSLQNISSKLDLMVSCYRISYDGSLSIDGSSLSNWSRILSVPWDLHALMEGFSPSTTGCIIDLQSNDYVKCSIANNLFTLHGLYWVLWEPLSLLVVSLILVNSSHHWLVIKWFLPCSTLTQSIAWIESY